MGWRINEKRRGHNKYKNSIKFVEIMTKSLIFCLILEMYYVLAISGKFPDILVSTGFNFCSNYNETT